MSASRPPITDDQLTRAADAVRELLADDGSDGEDERQELGTGARLVALAHDVVARQCESETLISGEPYVQARAQEHGVERDQAQTPLGNVLAILERGPENNHEWSLVAALFVAGVGRRAAELEDEGERHSFVRKVAGFCIWLELGTPHRVVPLWSRLLDDDLCEQLYGALGAAVLDEDRELPEPAARGRNAVRVSVLGEADGAAPREALDRVAAAARDPFSRTLAMLALGRLSPEGGSAEQRIEGRLGRFPAGVVRSTLRWVSGWALVSWALRLLGSILGLRRSAEVELRGQSLTIKRRVSLLGRPVRSSEHTHRLSELHSARRAARYPFVHLLIGVTCFSSGLVLGGLFLFDGARAGDLTLLLLAAALSLGGAGLDLALDVLVPARHGKVALDLDVGRARTRVVGVDQGAADRLLQALASRLSG